MCWRGETPSTSDLKVAGEEGAILMKRRERGEGSAWWKMPVLRFETLTELTRWEGRGEVEKNWMLWWPGGGREGEMWVSYEMFGRWEEIEVQNTATSESNGTVESVWEEAAVKMQTKEPLPAQSTLALCPQWPQLNTSSFSDLTTEDKDDMRANTSAFSQANRTSMGGSSSSTVTERQKSPSLVSNVTSQTTSDLNYMASAIQLPIRRSITPSTPSGASGKGTAPNNYTFQSGRSISQLLYMSHNILAQPNATHPEEPPCLLPPDVLTSLQNQNSSNPTTKSSRASTHQSTPALRLILCQRPCKSSAHEWLQSGQEVHFSIVHRKLHRDDGLGLVGKGGYERWVVIWEERAPGRIVAVGRRPVAFVDEVGEDEGGSGSEEGTGFVYTTSVSWAWRADGGRGSEGKNGDIDEEGHLDGDVPHLFSLGTGFLGDEIVLGIGIDDVKQVVVKVKVDDLLSCLMLCSGMSVDNEVFEK